VKVTPTLPSEIGWSKGKPGWLVKKYEDELREKKNKIDKTKPPYLTDCLARV
jgi:hypothetical protein